MKKRRLIREKRVYRPTGTLGNLIPSDSEQLGNSDLKIAGVNSPTRTLSAIPTSIAYATGVEFVRPSLRFLLFDPLVSAGVEQIKGKLSPIDNLIVEDADIKLGPQFLLSAFAELKDF
jgi:hypothetical protein